MKHCKKCQIALVASTEMSVRAERIDDFCTLCAAKNGDLAALQMVRTLAHRGDRVAQAALADTSTLTSAEWLI